MLFLAYSCGAPEGEVAFKDKYFDTPVFIDSEIEKLLAMNLIATKTIYLDNESETTSQIEVNKDFLVQEFSVLADANINRPAMYGRYAIDTAHHSNYTSIIYSTDDAKLKTKRLEHAPGKYVKATLANNNFMNSFEKDFTYEIDQFIKINGWQKSLFEDTLFYSVRIDFEAGR
jgi:hypothetical protein